MTEAVQFREHHSLQQLLDDVLAMRCPHCEVFVRMVPQGTPSWQWLDTHRPRRLGLSLLCPSCRMPVFITSGPINYRDNTIEFTEGWTPSQRAAERFDFDLLPASLQDAAIEAFGCYRDEYWQAFALLAHEIVGQAARELGADGRLQLFNAVTEAASLSGVEPALARLCRNLLFDLEPEDGLPDLSPRGAQVLAALLRDLLYEAFVRRGRLSRAMSGAPDT